MKKLRVKNKGKNTNQKKIETDASSMMIEIHINSL